MDPFFQIFKFLFTITAVAAPVTVTLIRHAELRAEGVEIPIHRYVKQHWQEITVAQLIFTILALGAWTDL